ncbi:SURF1 family protein [Methylovirgula sp. 4M-Z18]|nr:SURF1 family protein [Methylovirgula sp. 4M-Z18]
MAFSALCVIAFVVFTSLGIWQIQRRAWKLDLIAAIDSRIHASATDAPGPQSWPQLSAEHDAYRHVRIEGAFLGTPPVLVQAVTELGPGYWVMSPLHAARGFTILINRGFVAQDDKDRVAPPPTDATVTGLLRMTEPGGGFLRKNDPDAGRWYSRDVAAIAKVMNVPDAAPYFVDADTALSGPGQPFGGLTVVNLPNNHLVYVITWFALAAMAAAAWVKVMRNKA